MSLSLQATRIRNILFRALRDTVDFDTRQFSDDFVYSNPSITQLAEYLVLVAQGALTPDGGAAFRVDAMHKMVQKYSKDFPTISQSRAATLEAGKIVLVTGTTGGLGCHILANLILDETVAHIYAVNRPGSVPATKRQQKTFADHGLDVDMTKVTMLEVDLSVGTLVLDQASTDHLEIIMVFIILIQIINSVTHIVHNGTKESVLVLIPFDSSDSMARGFQPGIVFI